LDLIEDAPVRSELRDALVDGFIDDSEVGALIRATLGRNAITHQELRDLMRVAHESNALSGHHSTLGLACNRSCFVALSMRDWGSRILT
jgi:hypothetical protein